MWNIVETFSGSRRVFFYGRHARGWKIRLHPRFAVAPRKFSAMLITDGRAPMLERAPLICMLAASLCAGYAFGSCWQWRENAKQNFFSLERRHRRSQVALTRAGTDKRCIFHCTLFSVHRHTTFVFLLVSCRVRASAKRSIPVCRVIEAFCPRRTESDVQLLLFAGVEEPGETRWNIYKWMRGWRQGVDAWISD